MARDLGVRSRSRCRCRRAGRPAPSAAGSARAAGLSAARRRPPGGPRRGRRAAQCRGEHDLGFDRVPRGADAGPASCDGALGVPDGGSRRPLGPSPARRTPRRAAPAAAGWPIAEPGQPAATRSSARRRGEPADPERVGGQPDQRVGAGLGVAAGRRQRPAVPRRGPGRASRAGAGTTPGCCAPARRARRAAADRCDAGPGRPARCRSGPARLRRRPAATAARGVAAGGSGQSPGLLPNAARQTFADARSSARRYQLHRPNIDESALVNSSWSHVLHPCQLT